MIRLLFPPTLGSVRSLSLVAAATLMLSIAASERTEAMSPINPGPSPAAQDATDDLTIPVRGGHGHSGGHGHGGGHWHGGGGHWHGGGGWHRGGGWHGGGWHHARFHHFHHRRFYGGGYYPYYSNTYYYPRRCRIVYTYWGPRRVCHRRYWHRRYWY
jgi:hypothetical protein